MTGAANPVRPQPDSSPASVPRGARVLAAMQDAAEILDRLRAALAARVDEKVAAAVRIDDRTAGVRGVWLAAADAVLRGAAHDSAVEVVTAQIAPYVDADIGAEWMAAMRAGTDGVSTAYRQAAEHLAELGGPPFEIATPPGVPAAAPARRAAPSPAVPSPPPPSPTWSPPPAASAVPLPPSATLPDSPLAASAASPLAPLAPSAAVPPSAPTVVEEPARRHRRPAAEPEETDNPEEADNPEEPAAAVPAAPSDDPVAHPEPLPQNETAAPAVPPAAPLPTPVLPPPLAAEAPDPQRTPCEIAADELPQVGQ